MKETANSEGRRTATRRKSPEERWTDPAEAYRPGDAIPDANGTREDKIAVLAYYKAERRGFAGERELDDWLEAEREVDGVEEVKGMQNEEER